jgi:hypothetical protein
MRKLFYGLLLLFVSLVISDCTSANDFPTGEFYMPIIEDYRAPLAWGIEGAYFEFNDDGTYTVTDTAGVQRLSGTYRIDGNLYTVISTSIPSCDGLGPATYRWTFQNGFLTFIDEGKDKCTVRRLLMDRRYLKYQE